MKSLALMALLAGGMLLTSGCATPGYTPQEHVQIIARNMDYDFKQAADDWDYLLLLNPPSRMTIWNIR